MGKWRDKYKAEEQAWMVLKGQYAEVAQALGIDCDAWFGDPLVSHEEVVARAKQLATRPPVAPQQDGGDWISLGGFVDPPEAPEGFRVEVKLDSYMGFATDYRFVPA